MLVASSSFGRNSAARAAALLPLVSANVISAFYATKGKAAAKSPITVTANQEKSAVEAKKGRPAKAAEKAQGQSTTTLPQTKSQKQTKSKSAISAPDVSKAKQLRQMLLSKELEFIMEAHNGLSAVIVQEAGFKGIWASGLSVSASLGVRDSNEASWTQVLDVCEYMSDRTSIPILLDGDTGYGNYNNARRLVQKLESRGIAGVCLEDKLFPKTNSFIGEGQPLADVVEFSNKIRACKDAQKDSDFNVVARVEALIAGWGVPEAIKRGEAYRKAGADAILIHSKLGDCREIDEFMKEWAGRHPVIIVPTKYYKTPTQHFRDLGVSLCIWANHNCRAAITAMQRTSQTIFKEQSLVSVEPNIATVNEIFRLQNEEELRAADDKYLPQ
eukprot:gnl/Spiro4/11283_TR5946_c0_g1_i1.p1 gnl/Spiro4/11283_TR5946_c0_g1~~gnl/Spiro4/11283_TR5946_c0_g1_i1.p1  ORF type:complete len:411 (+),score=112.62 gnl/Spiro4/11283_TR5946_c0_g1_i1:78-1235(+)